MNEINSQTRKRKNGIETQNRILEVSAGLFAEKGFDSVTTREIAAGAGIKDSSLYNHFKSKYEILASLFDLYAENTGNAWPCDEDIERMMDYLKPAEIMKYVLYHLDQRINGIISNITRIIFMERFRNRQAAELYFSALVDKPVNFYTRLFTKMKDRKLIKNINPETYARKFNYVSVALTMEYFMAKNGFADPDTAVANLVENVEFFCNLLI